MANSLLTEIANIRLSKGDVAELEKVSDMADMYTKLMNFFGIIPEIQVIMSMTDITDLNETVRENDWSNIATKAYTLAAAMRCTMADEILEYLTTRPPSKDNSVAFFNRLYKIYDTGCFAH